jgi:hypothetical protein
MLLMICVRCRPLQLHNITPNTGMATRPVYSGWCPRVSRPDFIFDYQYM